MEDKEKKSILSKIGNAVSTLLLGDFKIEVASIGIKLDNLDKDLSEFKNDVNKRFDRVDKKFDEMEDEISGMKYCTGNLYGAVIEIQTHLASTGFTINQKIAYKSGSPLKLTGYGELLMRESGFRKTVSDPEKLKYLINLVRAKNPQTNYDIQDFSMKVMAELAEKNDPIAKPLKEYTYEKGDNLTIILNSAGIVLRDEVMKEIKFGEKI